MFEKDRIAIDISKDRIAIAIGSKVKIKKASIIETPKNSYSQDRIDNVDLLVNVIKNYLSNERINTKEVCFVIKGQDIITRHTILPLLEEGAMREAISWELRQYLNDRIDEYYYDYEVLKEIGEGKAKNGDVIITAVEMSKINAYIELAEKLELELVTIDSYATVGARLIKNLKIFKDKEEVIGLLTLNSDTSSLHISSVNKLEIEKYQALGILGENQGEISTIEDYNNYLYKIDLFNEEKLNEETLNSRRIINTIGAYFNSIIQFYTAGKVKKNLDKFYLIGTASNIKGIIEKFKENFNTEVEKIDDFKSLRYMVKIPRNIKLNDYFYSYGLLLSNVRGNNLVPYELRMKDIEGKKKISSILVSTFILALLLGGFGYLKGKEIYLNSTKLKLIDKIAANQGNVDKLNNLENDINIYNAHIEKVKLLNEQKDKKTDDLIVDIQKLIPGQVIVSNFFMSNKSNILISGSCVDYNKITEFWANLREDERFKDSHITNIFKSNTESNFTIEILLQGGQQ